MGSVIYLKPKRPEAKVSLSDNFCEQTRRQMGITGLVREYVGKDIALVDIGEKLPVHVHVSDFTIIG